ncbi:MAG: high-affinity branched-chain amino acid ABC transporter permease LivM [Gammaproteobacteria bacterium]|nr:MAG: high-affinity branched-chain amino acid ABC transporter permease LivM [Gammaproteobacteria bacterium]
MEDISVKGIGKRIADAAVAALLAFILLFISLGIKIDMSGVETLLNARLVPVLLGTAAVFFLRLFPWLIWTPIKNRFGNQLNDLKNISLFSTGVLGQIPEYNRRIISIVLKLLLLVSLLIVPFALGSKQYTSMFINIYMYILLALGLNIIVGYAGLLNIGYIAFFAIGAYTYAILNSNYNISFWFSLPLSAIAAAIAGLLLGIPVLRLRGDYLAIVTLGFGQVLVLLLKNLRITGGVDGILGIDKPTLFGLEFTRRAKQGGTPFHEYFGIEYQSIYKDYFYYFIILAMLLLSIFIISRLKKIPIGRSWEALRENEIACKSLGINPVMAKLSAFVISSAFAGFAGCFFAAMQGSVSPESFVFTESVYVLSIVVLGGMGSTVGIILAAIFFVILKDYTLFFGDYRIVIFSVLLVWMMLWRPKGLFPAGRRKISRRTISDFALGVDEIYLSFGGLVAVDKVSFQVERGQIFSIIGPNGAGKTTVFNCISGFYKPDNGNITFDGRAIEGKNSHSIARFGLVRTFQNIRLFEGMTVIENLMIARNNTADKRLFSGITMSQEFLDSETSIEDEAFFWLDQFGLNGLENQAAGSLSYGQQRMLEIARCMMTHPKMLLLDEPAAGLNPVETENLDRMIVRLRDEFSLTILLIEHDMKLVMNISDHIMVLDQGRVIASGRPEQIQNNQAVIKAYLGEE